MSEEAPKAICEIAKATGKSIDAVEKIGSSLNRIFGGGLKELGGTFLDWASVFRYTNALNLVDKIEAIHKERKIQGKPVPIRPNLSIRLINAASLEEDDSLQDKWAALIANATDPKRKFDLKKIFITTLNELEPLDVKIIDWLYDLDLPRNIDWNEWSASEKDICSALNIQEEDCKVSLQSLSKLGCLEGAGVDGGAGSQYFSHGIGKPGARFNLTPFGRSLTEACKK